MLHGKRQTGSVNGGEHTLTEVWSMFESERGLITVKEPQSVHNFDLLLTDVRNERKTVVQPKHQLFVVAEELQF